MINSIQRVQLLPFLQAMCQILIPSVVRSLISAPCSSTRSVLRSAKRAPANVRRLNNRKWRQSYCSVGERSRALALLNAAQDYTHNKAILKDKMVLGFVPQNDICMLIANICLSKNHAYTIPLKIVLFFFITCIYIIISDYIKSFSRLQKLKICSDKL